MACCALWDAFASYVRLANDDVLPQCTLETCMQAAHTKYIASAMLVFPGLVTDNLENISTADLTPAQQAQLLVYALIGQHFAADKSNDVKQHAYLRFDSMRGSAQVVRPLCSFERTVYLSIIVLTILVLITVIVLQMLRRTARARGQADVLLTRQTESANVKRRVAS